MIDVGDRALTIGDVARIYQVSIKTVYRWLKDKEYPLPGIKLPGGTWRFRREHLEAFDRCHERNSPNPTTGSDSEGQPGESSGRTRSPVILDAFRRGRQSGRGPKSGGTNG
jgi:excisionase family DNA binding protein